MIGSKRESGSTQLLVIITVCLLLSVFAADPAAVSDYCCFAAILSAFAKGFHLLVTDARAPPGVLTPHQFSNEITNNREDFP